MLIRLEPILHAHISRENELDTTSDIRDSTRHIPLPLPDTHHSHLYKKTIICTIFEFIEVFGSFFGDSYTRDMIILHKCEFLILE